MVRLSLLSECLNLAIFWVGGRGVGFNVLFARTTHKHGVQQTIQLEPFPYRWIAAWKSIFSLFYLFYKVSGIIISFVFASW